MEQKFFVQRRGFEILRIGEVYVKIFGEVNFEVTNC